MYKKDLSFVLAEKLFSGTSVEEIADRHNLSLEETIRMLMLEDRYISSEELRRYCELVRVEPVGKFLAYTYLMKK